jgi:hypothetical protein
MKYDGSLRTCRLIFVAFSTLSPAALDCSAASGQGKTMQYAPDWTPSAADVAQSIGVLPLLNRLRALKNASPSALDSYEFWKK